MALYMKFILLLFCAVNIFRINFTEMPESNYLSGPFAPIAKRYGFKTVRICATIIYSLGLLYFLFSIFYWSLGFGTNT